VVCVCVCSVRNESSRYTYGITSLPFELHATNLPWNMDKTTKIFLSLKWLLCCACLIASSWVLWNGAIHTARGSSVLLVASRIQVSHYCSEEVPWEERPWSIEQTYSCALATASAGTRRLNASTPYGKISSKSQEVHSTSKPRASNFSSNYIWCGS
jgi:hypothetical protein